MRKHSCITAVALYAVCGVAQGVIPHLLLTAVVVQPSEAELVAIYNPNDFAVDLSNYYLADYETYYLVVNSTPPNSNDFVVRFPAGATIGAGETQYVSIAGAECFRTACGSVGAFVGYGVYPAYEIASSTAANSSATVPDMVVPFAGSVGASRSLTNGGEPIMLFYWSGVSDLVTDVDYVYFGTPIVSSPAVNKTGIMVNGSSYLPDTTDGPTLHAPLGPIAANGTVQTCRAVPFTEGTQILSGGNGVGGADETSEPSSVTWRACPLPVAPDRIFADSLEG